MKRLVRKANNELIRRRVENYNALTSAVHKSMAHYLKESGAIRVGPYDASVCEGASLRHLSRSRIEWFLEAAQKERNFPLESTVSTRNLMTHLNLLEENLPTNAAVLLFGANPRKFHRSAEIKCIHCHGTAYKRPFASQQIYHDDLFMQADQGLDFVLSKINRAVGTRETRATAPAAYELPPEAVREAIINALAHRNYTSKASVEVRLFSDRLEVWNPGLLPGNLTLESLRVDHPSVPHNPLIAGSLYLARYIEKAGSGTQAMIDSCREAGLPEPDFEQRRGSFVVTLWRDWLTTAVIAALSLSDRQRQAIAYVKTAGRISNSTYQAEFEASKRTASRDLNGLVDYGILEKVGTTGKGVHYRLVKGAIKGPKGP